jgi:hypothetical protein
MAKQEVIRRYALIVDTIMANVIIEQCWILFGALLLVHLLYDFHWQGDFIGVGKSKHFFLLLVHCVTYTLCIAAVLYWFNVLVVWKVILLFVSHLVVDYWKCRIAPKETSLTTALWLDQAAHVLILTIVVL